MADSEDIKLIEIPCTTLMKIVKNCREKGNDEHVGVIMGTITDQTCFVGNCFPHHSKKSIVRHAPSAAKAKKTIVEKAIEHYEGINYDNTVVGIYINVPVGKFYASNFIHEILTSSSHDMLNDAKICISYERTLAELGMNPFRAFKFSRKFIENIQGKKVDEIMKDKIDIEELEIKIFRSSYDQAFLAEYVCPKLSEFSGMIQDDVSMSDICCNFLTLLESEIDNHIYLTKNNEHEVKKLSKAAKKGKSDEAVDINKVEFIQSLQTIEELNSRIKDVVSINLSNIEDEK